MPVDPLQLPLRDIHLPDAVSVWPLAYGWWILTGLILCGIVLAWLAYRTYQTRKYAAITLAKQELSEVKQRLADTTDPKSIVNEISVLLRRVSISVFSRTESASLTGEAWLGFLDDVINQHLFLTPEGRVLIEGPYRPGVSHKEVESLLALCEGWLENIEKAGGKRD